MKRCIAFLSLLHLATPALALTIRVGADPGCDTSSLATAINQAKANPGADTIRIAANQSYAGQSLFIDSDVTLRGGYANCDAAAPSGRTALVGTGNWAVLSLYSNSASGIDVRLEGLDISNGGASGEIGDWGGVKVAGRARARLADLRLHHNRASFGGGLTLDSQNAIVELERQVEIDANSAALGGGVGVFAGTLRIRPHGVSIHSNSAGNGGGLFVDFGLVTVGSDVEALAGPVDGFIVRNNSATTRGGGVYVNGNSGKLLAEAIVVRDNSAGEGGGIYAANGGYVQFLRYTMGPQRHCTQDQECLRLSGNSAQRGGGIALSSGASAFLSHSIIRDHSAAEGPAISLRDQNSELRLVSSVVARNRCDGTAATCAPLRTSGGKLRFGYTTFVGNASSASPAALIYGDGQPNNNATRYELYSSVVSGNQSVLFTGSGAAVTQQGDCVVVDNGQLPGGFSRSDVAALNFADAARNDFRLRPGSVAIDYCDAGLQASEDPDLDGIARGLEVAGNANEFGPYDLGAFESDRIFASGSEAPR